MYLTPCDFAPGVTGANAERIDRMAEPNLKPEQIAREPIDWMLRQSGWIVQPKNKIDFSAAPGIAIRENQTGVRPADCVLIVDKAPVGVIEAKPEASGQKLTTVEAQSGGYATARLKWVSDNKPLPFIYESTGVITCSTCARDPIPRSGEVFGFLRSDTMRELVFWPASLRTAHPGPPGLGSNRPPRLPDDRDRTP